MGTPDSCVRGRFFFQWSNLMSGGGVVSFVNVVAQFRNVRWSADIIIQPLGAYNMEPNGLFIIYMPPVGTRITLLQAPGGWTSSTITNDGIQIGVNYRAL